jgi:anti-anti-sigma factor
VDIPGVRIDCLGQNEIAVFSIVGQVSQDFFSEAAETFHSLIEKGHRFIVLDLAQATGVSSSGVGVVVYCHKLLKDRGGSLVIVSGPPSVMKPVDSFVKPIIPIVRTLDEALALLREHVSGTVKVTS